MFLFKFGVMKIQIINGPNLNLLGVRERSIYGNTDFESYLADLRKRYPAVEIDYYQSNVEGEIINKIHEVGFSNDGIVINAGAYTQTTNAKTETKTNEKSPVIEVHISNVYK